MSEVKFGVFGLWRGASFVGIINRYEGAVVTAVCDRSEVRRNDVKNMCEKAGVLDRVAFYEDFDAFLEADMDVVFLCNNFHEHAKYAIKALEKGKHVISECISGATLKECVDLCRAVEKSGCKYMIAENYPFTNTRLEMARLSHEGLLGKILYADGEYNHPSSTDELKYLTPDVNHWRAWYPRTYYITHSMGPLMYMANAMPVKVNARAVYSPALKDVAPFRHNADAITDIHCVMDNGAICRFCGCNQTASPSGYRIMGERGAAEMGRGVENNKVMLTFNHWEVPEGYKQYQVYEPEKTDLIKLSEDSGHGGGDFFMIHNMVEAIKNDAPIFFDVYKGAAMTATAIYSWLSILNDGATYYIPDFRNEEERKLIENDDRTPFPREDGTGMDFPACTKDAADMGYKI